MLRRKTLKTHIYCTLIDFDEINYIKMNQTFLQSTKILLLPPKCEIIFYPLKMVIFQYCDSNIGLFSINPHLVIALPTLQ